MKTFPIILVLIAGFAFLAYHQWYTSGAATDCSFFDTLLQRCGAQ